LNIATGDDHTQKIIGIAETAAKREAAGSFSLKFAAVTNVTPEGKALIQFDEDALQAQKVYNALKSYVPVKGDRVLVLNDIIIGGWTP
jgi:hypothetical protein